MQTAEQTSVEPTTAAPAPKKKAVTKEPKPKAEKKAKSEKPAPAEKAPALPKGERTFAIRVTEKELKAYHKAAGPGGGVRWARTILGKAAGIEI